MATLTDNPSFTANEVIALLATDLLEGVASGASFGGIGRSNQQAQQLANRTALLRNNQIIDESNIAALQAFQALFVGLMGQNGYVKVPITDAAKGTTLSFVAQWGLGLHAPPASPPPKPTPKTWLTKISTTVTWPLAFPNSCFGAVAFPMLADIDLDPDGDNDLDGIFEPVGFFPGGINGLWRFRAPYALLSVSQTQGVFATRQPFFWWNYKHFPNGLNFFFISLGY